jgi:NADH dehydrogenase
MASTEDRRGDAGQPHVVILGGGFGGLYAARALRRAPVRVMVVDRSNHHLFQPLLYQVATAALNPSDIATPIRRILRRQRNARGARLITGTHPPLLSVAAATDEGVRETRAR